MSIDHQALADFRMAALLRLAADEIEEGRSPYSATFLREHEIGLDELRERLATTARASAYELDPLTRQRLRWRALRNWLSEEIEHDVAVQLGALDSGDRSTATVHGALASANRSALEQMRELEGR
jgi:hypothetical protein